MSECQYSVLSTSSMKHFFMLRLEHPQEQLHNQIRTPFNIINSVKMPLYHTKVQRWFAKVWLVLLLGIDLSKQCTGCFERSKGTLAASSPRCNNKSIIPPPYTSPESGPMSREPANRRKRARLGANTQLASPYRRPRRCRYRPSEQARSPAAGSASGCPRQAAAGPPSSLSARPPPTLPAAPRIPLTRTSGATSQHGASASNSACTRDKQRRFSAAGYDPERPSPFPSAPPEKRARKGLRRPAAPFRPRPCPVPGRPRTVRPSLPARGGPGQAQYLRGAALLFVEHRARDLLPSGRLRPTSQRPPVAPSLAPPPPAAPHVLLQAADARTVATAAAAAPRSPTRAASPGNTFPASVGRRPAARARRLRDQSAALRPGRDTTASRPGHYTHPWQGAPFLGPGSATHLHRLGTPLGIRGPTGLR